MISDGLITKGRTRPSFWNSDGEMDKYFGWFIPSEFYPAIEEKATYSTDNIYLEKGWTFRKEQLTTKPMPWDSVTVKFDSDEVEDFSWDSDVKDGSYDSDLDRLDAISSDTKVGYVDASISFWDDYIPPTTRVKKKVEMIPHKSRRIF
jgi:hypothetical protein